MTKLTNEELRKLLRQYAAAMYAYTVSEYDSDDERQANAKADEIEAEILQRMAEGAAGEASPLPTPVHMPPRKWWTDYIQMRFPNSIKSGDRVTLTAAEGAETIGAYFAAASQIDVSSEKPDTSKDLAEQFPVIAKLIYRVNQVGLTIDCSACSSRILYGAAPIFCSVCGEKFTKYDDGNAAEKKLPSGSASTAGPRPDARPERMEDIKDYAIYHDGDWLQPLADFLDKYDQDWLKIFAAAPAEDASGDTYGSNTCKCTHSWWDHGVTNGGQKPCSLCGCKDYASTRNK